MARKDLDDAFSEVISLTALKAKKVGFKRRGNNLKKIYGGNIAIIDFQKSQSNTSEILSFTVNLAVVCGALLDPERLSLEKAKVWDGHFRVRIGELASSHQDQWWQIKLGTDLKALRSEVVNLVCGEGIPYVERYLGERDLLELWESGKSPGLTDGQRLRYLNELRNRMKIKSADT